MKKIKRAIISVSDKSNLKKLVQNLGKFKIKLISSGGTYKEIRKLGFTCEKISNYTNTPEILDGRVKTLHPKIYAGILSKRKKKSHIKDLKKNSFKEIDLVIVNFYPFEKNLEISKNHEKIIENIDIGGPTMVRAAAKNYKDITVITSTEQYENLIKELNKFNGKTSLKFRQEMSENAFGETAYYDSIIANYFTKITLNRFPKKKIISGNLIDKLRYGENPHQEAAIYSIKKKLNLNQISGKKLSYNNYNDIFSSLLISKSLPKGKGVVIVKHSNPCGISINNSKIKSYHLALSCDPISAFGGVVSLNFKLNESLAKEINKIFFEVVVANGFEKKALKVLKKKKNLRIINAGNINKENILNIKSNFDTFLIQTSDTKTFNKKNFKVVSKVKPSRKILKNLIFAFNISKYVKSNAVVLVKDETTVGIGSGQPSRLDSCKIAIDKMKKFQKINKDNQVVAASDAFFPFVDGIESLVQSGICAVIQPSGSINDKEIIKFANQTGTILVFSKTRHFNH